MSKKFSVQRNFTGSVVPVASELGKILINSKESHDIAKGIRELSHEKTSGEIKLSPETTEKINAFKASLKRG